MLMIAAIATTGANRSADAVVFIDHARVADPQASGAWERLAIVAERAGEAQIATSAWKHIVDARPDVKSVLRCGVLLSKSGQHRLALETYQTAIEAGLDDVRIFARAAEAAAQGLAWETAKDLWTEVVRRDDTNATAHLELLRSADAAIGISDTTSTDHNHLLELKSRIDFDVIEERASRSAIHRTDRAAERASSMSDPWHLLLVCHHNWSFISEVIELCEREPSLDVRSLDTSAVFKRGTPRAGSLPLYAKDLLEWADVILIEWVNEAADWLVRHVPKATKVVMRLHSYELLTRWPLLIDWAGSMIASSSRNTTGVACSRRGT